MPQQNSKERRGENRGADFTPRLTLGIEAYGGIADKGVLGRSQLQFMVGGEHAVRNGLAFTFGLMGGEYVASPRIGGQIGFSLDFPGFLRRRSGGDQP